MNNPKSQDVLKVIRNFEKVLPMAKKRNHLNMAQVRVRCSEYYCGTIHCAGGWYMVSKLDSFEFKYKNYVGFEDGTKEMEKDLGFSVHEEFIQSELMHWARNNENIWGNSSGFVMFSSEDAYRSVTRPEGAKSLHDIIDHWKEVYERLLILEGEQPKEKPLKTVYVAVPVSITEQAKELILS